METTTTEQGVPPVPAQPSGTVVNPLPLHWFQKDAVAAAVREVKDGGRATIVAATGSGKTLIAAGRARRLAARGRVLVLVPTIELLEQTAEAWSLRGGRRGLAVAACSRQEALESAEAGGRVHAQVTTQAVRITDLVNGAPDNQPVTRVRHLHLAGAHRPGPPGLGFGPVGPRDHRRGPPHRRRRKEGVGGRPRGRGMDPAFITAIASVLSAGVASAGTYVTMRGNRRHDKAEQDAKIRDRREPVYKEAERLATAFESTAVLLLEATPREREAVRRELGDHRLRMLRYHRTLALTGPVGITHMWQLIDGRAGNLVHALDELGYSAPDHRPTPEQEKRAADELAVFAKHIAPTFGIMGALLDDPQLMGKLSIQHQVGEEGESLSVIVPPAKRRPRWPGQRLADGYEALGRPASERFE